jgi:hypothetical protein
MADMAKMLEFRKEDEEAPQGPVEVDRVEKLLINAQNVEKLINAQNVEDRYGSESPPTSTEQADEQSL